MPSQTLHILAEAETWQAVGAKRVRAVAYDHGTSLTPSMRGVTKRHHKEGFLAVASRVLELRGMAPATEAEVADAQRVGRIWAPLYRRLELVTPLVGNAAEFAVNADRAAALEEAGLQSELGLMFSQ
ncbi:unnamed protein product, partial [Symbiodinium sp. KB8]